MTTIFVLLILLAALTLVAVYLMGGALTRTATSEEELSRQIKPVDLEAFRNLIDAEEEEHLRTNLSASEFRSIERLRLRAAIDYLLAVSHNVDALLHFGQTARRSSDERIAEAARSLVENALRLRLLSAFAIAELCIRMVFPGTMLRPAGIADRYQQVAERAAQLGRLQYPGRGALLSRSL